MFKTEGLKGFYAGLGPILFKQIPYTMAKFAVQGKAAEVIYNSMGKTPDQLSSGANIVVSLNSGVIAGVAAAIISHRKSDTWPFTSKIRGLTMFKQRTFA